MRTAAPLRVVWLFAPEDESPARELMRLAAVLARQGIVASWSVLDVPSGRAPILELEEQLRSADVVVVISSPALTTSLPLWGMARSGSASIVPFILREGGPSEIDRWAALPSGGAPLVEHCDRDEAMLELVEVLLEMAAWRSKPLVDRVPRAPSLVGVSIDEVFRVNGPPSATFVEPPRFAELKHELRTMGAGLIVEGRSRAGKTTAARKALEALGASESNQQWLCGKHPPDLAAFQRTLDAVLDARHDRWLFIDDFHCLEQPAHLRALAARMKVLADRPERHGKITLIGIGTLGSSLISAMPDLAGRFRVCCLDADSDRSQYGRIGQLITQGEQAANIRFRLRDDFIRAASRSFYLANMLCNRAAACSGITRAPAGAPVEISLGPRDVIASLPPTTVALIAAVRVATARAPRSAAPRRAVP